MRRCYIHVLHVSVGITNPEKNVGQQTYSILSDIFVSRLFSTVLGSKLRVSNTYVVVEFCIQATLL